MFYSVHMVTKQPLTVTEALGRVISAEAKATGLTHSSFALKLGLGRDTLRRRLEGPEGFKSAELETIAKILGTSPTALVIQAEALSASNQAASA